MQLLGFKPSVHCVFSYDCKSEEPRSELIGLPFKTVTESGAPQAGKHFMFINPVLESPYTEATALFIKCLEAGLKTIVFTKARKITELIYKWTVDRAPQFAEKNQPLSRRFPAEGKGER